MTALLASEITRASDEPARTHGQEIAKWLLSDDLVLSVTVDRESDEAFIHYRDSSTQRDSLSQLATSAREQQNLLRLSSVVEPPSVLCWPDEQSGRIGYVREPQQATGWRRVMHLSLAGLWFTLAVIGAILPGVPTTCFLLLCSYSLLRSSHRLHQRLLDSRWFGPSLRHWRLYRGVRPGVKTKAMTMLIGVVGLTIAFSGLPQAALLGIAGGASIGAFCILRLKVVDV